MRKQWFGDNRDYVKWSCIRQEAADSFVVLYGAMLRPDTPLDDPLLDDDVIQFFNRQRNFAALSELFPCGLTVEDSLYSVRGADAYFSHLVERMCRLQVVGKILVFLDPDTGIEPKGKLRDEHLRVSDVRKICQALNPLDKLVIYQHALREAHWMVGFKVRLEAVCVETDCVVGEAFHAPNVAKDVCFFVINKVRVREGQMTVIQCVDTNQRLLDCAARADVREGIRQGLEDSMKNRVRPVTEFFAEFEARHGIADALP